MESKQSCAFSSSFSSSSLPCALADPLHPCDLVPFLPPVVRFQLDPRVRTAIDNAAKCNHRCFFVVVGDKGRDQVVDDLVFPLAWSSS